MQKVATWAAAVAALALAGPLRAHHSISMFNIAAPIWVKGTVVRYEVKDPHVMLALEERKDDGGVQRWTVEGPNLGRLARMDAGKDFLKLGDVVEVCGFALKSEYVKRPPPSAYPDGVPGKFLHGHVLERPDGKMRLWGPYGKLDNCIRPGDSVGTWVEFLERDPLARQAWCTDRTYASAPSVAPQALLKDIDGALAEPCK